ncbi:MAG: cupin domain-containing protein [Candidatus Korobacteraceae bacterium]|jgi:quercetin dioxygenase-like cupin family protein
MKCRSILVFLGLIALSLLTLGAAPQQLNIGAAHELDTEYASPYNVNLGSWFAAHPLPARPAIPSGAQAFTTQSASQPPRMDVVFQTPRVVVLTLSIRGSFPLHYHTNSDEILVPVKGKCKEYVDGKWQWVQPGDIHYNPRGVVHGLQCEPGMEFQSFDIFTPALPPGGDRVFVDSKESKAKPGDVVADWTLIDTQFKKGANINADEFYASHPIPPGESMRLDLPIGTPRNQMVLAQKPALKTHYHGSSDEIIYVYKGVGEELIKGEWVRMKAGDIHFCPRGFVHAIRPVSDDFKIFAFFTPPQANGSDRIFVEEAAAK